MSFNKDSKESLCAVFPKRICCKLSLIYGFLYTAKEFSTDGILLVFENQRVKEYFSRLFFDVFSIELETDDVVSINDDYTLNTLFDLLDVEDCGSISDIVFSCESCAQSFLKGIYLSCGILNDPNKSYHLEFRGFDEVRANNLANYLQLQGLPFKWTMRKGKPVVYCKGVQTIELFLSYIGASVALFGILNAKMIGETRNSINRLSNFENANLNRTVSASADQVAAASKLNETGRFQLLPKELKETVVLRLSYPDVSLSALAAKHVPPITKSGLNNRLRRIIEIANEEQ